MFIKRFERRHRTLQLMNARFRARDGPIVTFTLTFAKANQLRNMTGGLKSGIVEQFVQIATKKCQY